MTYRIVYEKQFRYALKEIVEYIGQDKVSASQAFQKELKTKFELLVDNPKMHRSSKYHKDDAYRDLVFMGYTTIYKIEDTNIKILDIFKWIDK